MVSLVSFLVRRILQGVLIILLVSFGIFAVLRLVPGDPARLVLGPLGMTSSTFPASWPHDDLDAVTGKRCTFMAFPWRFPQGDGCPIRVVAVIDPDQTFRIPTGAE